RCPTTCGHDRGNGNGVPHSGQRLDESPSRSYPHTLQPPRTGIRGQTAWQNPSEVTVFHVTGAQISADSPAKTQKMATAPSVPTAHAITGARARWVHHMSRVVAPPKTTTGIA